MGDCQCSNITIMQLFHELKQQFPALPDHVVSQCIAQNSHDREICARSLRAAQESRPSPGAFPPPPPDSTVNSPHCSLNSGNNGGSKVIQNYPHHHHHHQSQQAKSHRPVSLEVGSAVRQYSTVARCRVVPPLPTATSSLSSSSSAPTTYLTRGFFDEVPTNTNINVPPCNVSDNYSEIQNLNSSTGGFEVNVNVAYSPASNRDFRTVQSPGLRRNNPQTAEPRSHFNSEQRTVFGDDSTLHQDHVRSYTSVSLTLRPPSSEPQPPIDIRSQGSSLTYSTSSLNLRGFQSRLQISIGPSGVGNVAAARIRPPMGHPRPNSLISTIQSNRQRPPGLPAGPPSQLPRPTAAMSAPTTPSAPVTGIVTSGSLPTTPLAAQQTSIVTPSLPSSPIKDSVQIAELNRLPLSQVAEHQKQLITEQLIRKDRLAKKLAAEKGRLGVIKKELQILLNPLDPSVSPEELERKLRSEIYQLQLECDLLTKEVDRRSDPNVPLGETNEEFYQGIYTGQPLNLPGNTSSPSSPPLPNALPVYYLNPNQNSHMPNGENDDEKDGPSWVCGMCTFDNHPLMDQCEQCGMPRFPSLEPGETQDIHIRVTNHHNFSPRRTVHSWVV